MRSIFVSASVPDPRRDRHFYESADVVAIRDAISALVQVVTPQARLIFGGHPAITPMVARVAGVMGTLENVSIYQSAWFKSFFPEENAAFKSLVLVPRADDLRTSLALMRKEMLESTTFDTAFFVGGMEGVLEEYDAIQNLRRTVRCFPLATTGGAALDLALKNEWELREQGLGDLFVSYDYATLVRRLLRSETRTSDDTNYA